ncbi:unnamed protein product [Thelazia callipaeda]|uniref:Hydrophobic protein n=1 Tax=Thelazia callipaeda TaxID=103827 RepID=A0A0N5CM09_THECL|nr:unnamed protein product [Thelazia callipaeda]
MECCIKFELWFIILLMVTIISLVLCCLCCLFGGILFTRRNMQN